MAILRTESASELGYIAPTHRRSLAHSILGFMRAKPLAGFGGVVVVILVTVAIIGPWIAPYTYDEFDITSRFQGPSFSHLFGTDDQGRDQFSRVLYGARTSIVVAFSATLATTILSGAIGATSGYLGGKFDMIFQRILEVWQAFPGFIFLIFVVSILGSSELNVIITIALLLTAGSSRVIRSAALGLRGQPYVEAARALGAGQTRILVYHIVPNLFPIMIVTASVQIGAVIVIEASLSFLGFGVPPPHPTWGGMLQDSQRFMREYPYLALFPGLAIALVVYSFNMLGDGIRDVLDPRLRGI